MKNAIKWKKSTAAISDYTNNPFLSLQKEIDKAISHFYNIFETPSFYSTDIEKLIINLSVDIVEDDKNFKVEVEMPGMGEEDVKVTINDGILSIRGMKKISKKK